MKGKTALLSLLMLLSLLLSACASGGSTAAAVPAATPAPYVYSGAQDASYAEKGEIQIALTSGSGGSRAYTDAESKLIREASVTLQTVDFPAAVTALDDLTQRLGGYYESARTQGGEYYDSNAARYASYTVRVPKDACDAFLASVGEVGHVVSSSQSSTDVGDQYYDAEVRLKTLQTKQERLLKLLEKAEAMEDIIALENSLSDVQYLIEQYASTLKRYDGLVDFATISVSLSEVERLSNEPGTAAALNVRLANAFSRGFSDFGSALSGLALWLAYSFPGLLVAAAAVFVGVRIGRRLWKRRRDYGGGA